MAHPLGGFPPATNSPNLQITYQTPSIIWLRQINMATTMTTNKSISTPTAGIHLPILESPQNLLVQNIKHNKTNPISSSPFPCGKGGWGVRFRKRGGQKWDLFREKKNKDVKYYKTNPFPCVFRLGMRDTMLLRELESSMQPS